MLDAAPFKWTDPVAGSSLSLYSLLAAYGYDRNGKNGRLWKVVASPTSDTAAWVEFLSSLAGKPESIVADQDTSISAAIDTH